MGAKASTSADPAPDPPSPSRDPQSSSGLAAILADLGRRTSIEGTSRRARSFSGGVGGTLEGGGVETPGNAHGAVATPIVEAQSLPLHFMSFNGIKCPVCSKVVLQHDCELHLVMCLTKPTLAYNEETLLEDREVECVICLEEFTAGQTIARLPCLCIYHKSCIDSWFRVNRSCPEHPSD